ncbi:MAG: HmuY family protein, partial [Bacteroidales bacterium]|nr:HmuY family protein [Bacteroidales bacterium]
MKRQLKLLAALMLMGVLSMATSCDNNKDPEAETSEMAVTATETGVWHYFSFTTGAEVGTGKESDDNAAWFARKDWDIAFNKYSIRTNSGEATTVGAQGGVYTFADNVTFADANLPGGAAFATDKKFLTETMGGDVETVKSEATVILFK